MKTAKFLGAWVVILAVVATGGALVLYGGRYVWTLITGAGAGTTMTRPDSDFDKPSTPPPPPSNGGGDAWGEWARDTTNRWGDWLMGKF